MEGLAPLRRALMKMLPVDLAQYQFDLAKSVSSKRKEERWGVVEKEEEEE